MQYCPELRICHLSDKSQKNLKRVIYHLAKNNEIIWNKFAPEEFLEDLIFDSTYRYQLIAEKEGVESAFHDGIKDKVTCTERNPVSLESFKTFTLLDKLDDFLEQYKPKRVVMCGCGKFPTFWANYLRQNDVEDVAILEKNSGLIGKTFKTITFQSPRAFIELIAKGYTPMIGHTSSRDTLYWLKFFDVYSGKDIEAAFNLDIDHFCPDLGSDKEFLIGLPSL